MCFPLCIQVVGGVEGLYRRLALFNSPICFLLCVQGVGGVIVHAEGLYKLVVISMFSIVHISR